MKKVGTLKAMGYPPLSWDSKEGNKMQRVTNVSKAFAFGMITSALVLVMLGRESSAEPASAWSQTPSWTQPQQYSGNSTQRKNKQERAERKSNVTPFAPGSHNFGFEMGQAFLMGDLGDRYSGALRYQLHYTYGVSEVFAFESSIGYSSHSDGQFSMTNLNLGVRTNFTWFDRIIPYASVGLGFYRPSVQITPTTSLSPVLFGLHLGPGVDLQLTDKLFFGTSITFNDVFGTTKETAKGPIDVGGTFTTFLLHAGVAL